MLSAISDAGVMGTGEKPAPAAMAPRRRLHYRDDHRPAFALLVNDFSFITFQYFL